MMHGGTVEDATIIATPSYTQNKESKRDPEMHQSLKRTNGIMGRKFILALTQEVVMFT